MSNSDDNRSLRVRYRPYFVAVALAFVLTMLVAPEIQESNVMEPTVREGGLIVLQKKTFSAKRGMPERGQVVVLDKYAIEDTVDDNAVRRVIAVGGDKVTYDRGTLSVNGNMIKEEYPSSIGDKWDTTLKEDEVFFICDNLLSAESSLGIGAQEITVDKIKGKAVLRVWPLTDIGVIR